MPDVDAIIITHSHAGHLEPDSLRLLPRSVPVFTPEDDTIALVLRLLEFETHRVVDKRQAIEIGDTRISFPGCSAGSGQANPLVEDPTGRLWYLGDRGDFLRPAVIDAVRGGGRIDVAIASHPSDFHSFFQHSTWDGGAQEGERHEEWLARSVETVRRLGATLSIPGTSSNRYRGDAAWLNHFVHPMRAEEFAHLVGLVDPDIDVATLRAGDAVAISTDAVTIERGAVAWVSLTGIDDDRGLDPTAGPPQLVDPNPEGLSREVLLDRCDEYLALDLTRWAERKAGPFASTLRALHALETRYRVTLVFDDETTALRHLTLRSGDVVFSSDAGTPADYGDIHLRIAASVLHRWVECRIPYYAATPYCRRAGQPVAIGARSDGTVSATRVPTLDLVTMHLTESSEGLHRWLAHAYGGRDG